jgi:hypothetical protein
MPTEEENVLFLYKVLTNDGPPVVSAAALCGHNKLLTRRTRLTGTPSPLSLASTKALSINVGLA